MSIIPLLFVLALLVPGVGVGTAASPEENVIVTGKVTDRNGDPITKCEVFFNRETWITDESIRAECDASGTYLIAVPKGHYNSVYICDEDKYGKTALEFWGWNLDIEEERVLDVTFDKLEVYSLAVWNSNGGRSGSCYMRVAIIQLERPVLMEGTHLVRIKITDHETGAIGEAVTKFSSNRAGYGF